MSAGNPIYIYVTHPWFRKREKTRKTMKKNEEDEEEEENDSSVFSAAERTLMSASAQARSLV